MKQILILGAGKSAPYLIQYLLDQAESYDWFVTVADIDPALARERVGGHPRGSAMAFDATDVELRETTIQKADIVVSMLTPAFHQAVAIDCVRFGVNLVTASYRTAGIRSLERDALRKNVLILSEMGLDPGIDHMSSMAVIRRLRDDGGRITGFRSYGSGLPAPDSPANPLRYVITWNPRNVVIAGQYGAEYLEDGKIKAIPYHEVFHHTWPVEVNGIGNFEAYPNRDSLSYKATFGLDAATTMIRGTLRYPGWSETWSQLVRLGLTNDTLDIPDLDQSTYMELVEMFLPLLVTDGSGIEERAARWLQISPTGQIMENLRWLGLFSTDPIHCEGDTAADVMTDILSRKLAMPPGTRDMVILQHEVDVEYPGDDRKEEVISTMVHYGEPNGFTAMAKTVGLPAAIGVKMILNGDIHLTGCHIPTHPSIYEPVLRELAANGIEFVERTRCPS